MNDTDLVSVVIPTHYRNQSLRRAIRSARDQTYEETEIIVVDDSGERHAEAVCVDLDVEYVAHGENRGGNPARNTGFEHSSGSYIQFLDDDDRLDSSKIEKQVRKLTSSPKAGVVYCGLEDETGTRRLPDPEVRGDVLHSALRLTDMGPCITGTMLIERDVLATITPLVARSAADDIGMKIRLARKTSFEYVDEVLLYEDSPDGNRSESPSIPAELADIIDSHRDAYDAAPDHVFRHAMKTRYDLQGYYALQGRLWSWKAIRAYWRALQYADGIDVTLLAAFVSAWLGTPGFRLASAVRDTFH